METALVVSDLEKAIESYIDKGYRLDMIMPADSPTTARLSKDDETILLQSPPSYESTNERKGVIVTRFDDNSWVSGRSGMQYRDLIPGRLGGRVIASHIRLTEGGEVPDYVHYHKVAFQMIYCKAGWIRVVYEDQGPPFILDAGDCVLQPPEIRHRVLESSAGAEVIEIGCPAVHETWVEHEMQLPTGNVKSERIFNGQRFVRHVAADAEWRASDGFQYRDTGISAATNGLANVRILKFETAISETDPRDGKFLFSFVLNGSLKLTIDEKDIYNLESGDCYASPTRTKYFMRTETVADILQVSINLDVTPQLLCLDSYFPCC